MHSPTNDQASWTQPLEELPDRCQNRVAVGSRNLTVRCGSQWAGEAQFCPACQAKLAKRYPQGWRYVPGDVCCHGTYIGSPLGEDLLCGYCEDGVPCPDTAGGDA